MVRDFQIPGPLLVRIKLGAHVLTTPLGSNNGNSALFELGLCSEAVSVTFQYMHHDLQADDFPQTPPELLWQGATVDVRTPLIHYDPTSLNASLVESQAANAGSFPFGTMPPAGLPMAGYTELQASGNHFISLNLVSPVAGQSYRFRACVLTGPPVTLPLGVEAIVAVANWRAISYRSAQLGPILSGFSPYTEITSSGVPLFDQVLDTA